MPLVLETPHSLRDLAGRELTLTDWFPIRQERIEQFAEVTEDRQWIHVDRDRAAAGPFGGTIAHGYLTLSLVIPMLNQILDVQGVSMGINYGLNKVRFPAPVPVGSKIRLAAQLGAVEDAGVNAVQGVIDCTIEMEGSEKPACAAQAVLRYYA